MGKNYGGNSSKNVVCVCHIIVIGSTQLSIKHLFMTIYYCPRYRENVIAYKTNSRTENDINYCNSRTNTYDSRKNHLSFFICVLLIHCFRVPNVTIEYLMPLFVP